jgi:hypothetical protein
MPKQRLAVRGEVNGDPVDWFSLAHFGWGAAMGALGFSWPVALGTALFWDFVLEPPMKNTWPHYFPHPTQDTVEHIATDAAAWLLGWGTAVTIQQKKL